MQIIRMTFVTLSFNKVAFSVPSEKPIPKMGPMIGEIIIAPMTAALELIFKCKDNGNGK